MTHQTLVSLILKMYTILEIESWNCKACL